MKRIRRVLRVVMISCAVSLLPVGLNAFAEEPAGGVTKLDEMIVTGSKKGATLLDTPASVSIITAEDIKKSGQDNLAAIISSVPGVINQSTTKDKTYFSFRGTKSPHVGGPIIMVDGKPYNFGVYGFNSIDNIPVDQIERIEVIKSPPPSLYGTNSARGVINIVTKSGEYAEKAVEIKASTKAGAWNTLKNSVTIYGKQDQYDYSLGFNYNRSDGYRHTDPNKKTFAGQFGYELDEGIKCGLDVNWSDYSYKSILSLKKWQIDDYRTDISYIRKNETNSTYNLRPNESDKELLTGGLSFNYDRDNWLFDTFVYLSNFDYIYQSLKYFNNSSGTYSKSNKCYTNDKDTNNIGGKVSGGYSFFEEGKFSDTVTMGYDFAREQFGQKKTYPYAATLSTTQETDIKKSNIDCDKDIDSLFITNDLKFLEKYGLLAGLRYDVVEYDLRNQVPQSATKKFKEFGWNVAPSLSITPDSNLFFSISESYWFPASAYIKSAMEKDHPDNKIEDLGPEEDLTCEVGFKHRLMKELNYSISLYQTKTKHKYMYFYDDAGTFQGWKPVGDSIHKGVEVEADGRFWEWLGYRVGFSLLDAEWDSAKERAKIHGATVSDDYYDYVDVSGKKLYDVPEYTYSAGLDFYPLKGLQMSVTVRGAGERYIDVLNRYKENTHNMVDARLSYTLKSWNFYVSGSNIFDEESEKLSNTKGTRDSAGNPDNSWYPRDGKYFELGATVTF